MGKTLIFIRERGEKMLVALEEINRGVVVKRSADPGYPKGGPAGERNGRMGGWTDPRDVASSNQWW
jgi:hypothetical protein